MKGGDRGRGSRGGEPSLPKGFPGQGPELDKQNSQGLTGTLLRMSFLATACPQRPQPASTEQDLREWFH